MTPLEKASLGLMALAGLFLLVAIILLLSRFTEQRLGTLGRLRQLLATYPTYVIGAIGVGNEVYNAFRYDTPFNWTSILVLLGITTATAQVRSGQKEVAATTQGIVETTDVILNTMPISAKTPVPRNPTVTIPEADAGPQPPVKVEKDSS